MALLELDTFTKKAIFITYVFTWVAFGLLNDAAKKGGVTFHPSSAVIVQSCLKLCVATGMFRAHDGTLSELVKSIRQNLPCLALYAFPAVMYAVYDVLGYVNIRKFGAAKYYVLVEFRMVLTAFAYQVIFQKKLGRYKWISVLLVFTGCIVRAIETVDFSADKSLRMEFAYDYGLVLLQVAANCCATVYNEFLLKKKPHIPTNLQNMFLYFNTIVCLICTLSFRLTGVSINEALDAENLAALASPQVLAMISIMSFGGILTSYFIKVLDSVRKVLANGIEIIILSVVTCVLYKDHHATPTLVVSVALVVSGTYLYSAPPSKYLPIRT